LKCVDLRNNLIFKLDNHNAGLRIKLGAFHPSEEEKEDEDEEED